jgi:hypothetical protein
MKKTWKLGIVTLIFAGVVLTFLMVPKRPTVRALPVPNGYDEFLKAAQLAVSHRHLAHGEADEAELRDLVEENREALTWVRAGLVHDSRVTTDYSLGLAAYTAKHMPALAQFKRLALAFRAEGELAEREGRTNDAARIYLDGIRFGQESSRGGLLIDRLVGIACEAITLDPLNDIAQQLDSGTCREIAQLLEGMEAKREPMQATWDEERSWCLHSGGIFERMRNRIMLLVTRGNLQVMRQKADPKLARVQTQERNLILHLTARADQLEHAKAKERPQDGVSARPRPVPTPSVPNTNMSAR